MVSESMPGSRRGAEPCPVERLIRSDCWCGCGEAPGRWAGGVPRIRCFVVIARGGQGIPRVVGESVEGHLVWLPKFVRVQTDKELFEELLFLLDAEPSIAYDALW